MVRTYQQKHPLFIQWLNERAKRQRSKVAYEQALERASSIHEKMHIGLTRSKSDYLSERDQEWMKKQCERLKHPEYWKD